MYNSQQWKVQSIAFVVIVLYLFSSLFCPFSLLFLFLNPAVIYIIIIACCLLATNNSNNLSSNTTKIISCKMLLNTRRNTLYLNFFFFFLKLVFEGFLGNDAFAASPEETNTKKKKKQKPNAYTKEEWKYKEEIQYCVLTHKEKQWVKCWSYHWLEWRLPNKSIPSVDAELFIDLHQKLIWTCKITCIKETLTGKPTNHFRMGLFLYFIPT